MEHYSSELIGVTWSFLDVCVLPQPRTKQYTTNSNNPGTQIDTVVNFHMNAENRRVCTSVSTAVSDKGIYSFLMVHVTLPAGRRCRIFYLFTDTFHTSINLSLLFQLNCNSLYDKFFYAQSCEILWDFDAMTSFAFNKKIELLHLFNH